MVRIWGGRAINNASSLNHEQLEWVLRANGLDELVDEASTAWQARAHVGDLEALRAKGRQNEAAALTDPDWGALAILDATTRMLHAIVRAGGLLRYGLGPDAPVPLSALLADLDEQAKVADVLQGCMAPAAAAAE